MPDRSVRVSCVVSLLLKDPVCPCISIWSPVSDVVQLIVRPRGLRNRISLKGSL